ncbi:uncharacterized protein LOC127120114 isoform X5 [Lathyrus oleraceus]|uniref:uncharacterized protein LOC127120114 isoform X5 n=1 Tax=Pisum sativum TaxID=3888 RepID=UPI0021D275F9|nr:uncharacterized protein LOC127120114 isoform X5 [Pisum sativum]
MADESDAFYVVKKGNLVGIYKSLTDIQPLLSSSVYGESVRVYKGFCLPEETEEYLVSHGLKGATYSISAANVNASSFGKLVACPYQDPYSSGGGVVMVNSSSKSLQSALQVDDSKGGGGGGGSFSTNVQRKHCISCTLNFDGASKGNPGLAGAGAILRADDGSKDYRLREGVGTATSNVAEYRALILGLKQALKKGYKHICVKGDSLLVCNQIQGLWKVKNPNMSYLCNEAKEYKNKFLSFKINHIPREYNRDADTQANCAVNLKDGEVEEDCEIK